MDDHARVEALTLKLLDDTLTEQEAAELEALLAASDEATRIHLSLLEQEGALRGMRAHVDLVARIMARITPLEASWRLGRRFWGTFVLLAAALLLIVAGLTVRIESKTASVQQIVALGGLSAEPGGIAPQQVLVQHSATAAPIGGATVSLAVLRDDGAPLWAEAIEVDEAGVARFEPELPEDLPEGSYTIAIEATSPLGTSALRRTLAVQRSHRLLLTSDKPRYQPGQVVHLRTMALSSLDGRPAADQPLRLEVRDAKGNKVFARDLTTSAYGVAAADFALADQVNTGTYTLSATLGDTTSERSVIVERYVLPRFALQLDTDRAHYAPGEIVSGSLLSTYTFGKPTTDAQVTVVGASFLGGWTPFAEASGRTNADGRFTFQLPLPSALPGLDLHGGDATVSLEVTVTDPAGHRQRTTHEVIVSNRPLQIEVFPESGALVAGVENQLYLLTTTPDGRPVRTTVTVEGHDPVETSASGVAVVRITPQGATLPLSITAEARSGQQATLRQTLQLDDQPLALLLRTDRAVYRAGDTALLSIDGTGSGTVFVEVVKADHTILTRSLQLEDGTARLPLDLPPDLSGTLQIRALRIGPDGTFTGDTRVVQVNRADALQISASFDRERYRPGGSAQLQLEVTDAGGQPVAAALGLAVVDEAVFALSELQPGLLRAYFALQEELLTPRHELHAHTPGSPHDALLPDPSPDEALTTTVLFSQAEGVGAPAVDRSEGPEEARRRLERERRDARQHLLLSVTTLPVGLLLLLFLPLLRYALWRLAHRQTEPADGASRALLRWVTVALLAWVAAFLLPWIVMLVTVLVLQPLWMGWISPTPVVLLSGLGTLLAALSLMIYSVRAFRRAHASARYPTLRALVGVLPLSFVLVALSTLALLPQLEHRAVGGYVAALLCLVLAINTATPGLLAAGAAAALRPVSALGWLGRLLGWSALSCGWVLVFVLLFFSLGSYQAELAAVSAPLAESAPPMDPLTPTDKSGPGEDAGGTRVRRHFPETLLWLPELITDADGRASVAIELADSITTWRASISGVSADGALGATTARLQVFQEFFVDVDLPVALTQGDRITVPVAIYSYLDRPQQVRLQIDPAPWMSLSSPLDQRVWVQPGQVLSVPLELVALQPGTHGLTIHASGDALSDAVERQVRVEPDGRRVTEVSSGRLEEELTHTVTVPEEAIDGANDLFVKLYPGTFSQVAEGLDSIFRMPSGCFEQTSSATYPNVLVLDYLRETGQLQPELELKALEYIHLGHQRLLSFEVDGGGFEWFGRAPAHTVLTAYGLMEFDDMAEVIEVDPAVLRRTEAWLYAQQASDGTWAPPQGGIREGAINAHVGETLRTTAYIAWALAEAADERLDPRLQRTIDWLAAHADETDDPYTLAVISSALVLADHQAAGAVLQRLRGLATVEGKLLHWSSDVEGVTHSRGDVLAIETTAIAAYAHLRAGEATDVAHKALSWLLTQKDALGNWHSTQATIHVFRALLAGTDPSSSSSDAASVEIWIDGQRVETVQISPESRDVLRLISLTEHAGEGDTQIVLRSRGGGDLSYQLVATHHLPWGPGGSGDPGDAIEPMSIDVSYDATRLARDEEVGVEVAVTWNAPGDVQMAIVDLGIPPGFDAVEGTFDALVQQGTIEKYTVTGRQVVLYLRQLRSGQPLALRYQLRARHPVVAKAPPVRAYPYYEPAAGVQGPPVQLQIR